MRLIMIRLFRIYAVCDSNYFHFWRFKPVLKGGSIYHDKFYSLLEIFRSGREGKTILAEFLVVKLNPFTITSEFCIAQYRK